MLSILFAIQFKITTVKVTFVLNFFKIKFFFQNLIFEKQLLSFNNIVNGSRSFFLSGLKRLEIKSNLISF